MLDIFDSNAFSMVTLTNAVNAMPPLPSYWRNSGIFRKRPVDKLRVAIEEKDGLLSLVPTKPRGARGTSVVEPTRRLRYFDVPHIPMDDSLMADDLIGIRAFGTENQTQAITAKVNERLSLQREALEATMDWHMIGAISGVVTDADGSTVVYNFFDEFGITEEVFDFAFSTATTDVKQICLNILRSVRRGIGRDPYTGVRAVCGNGFFDALTSHATVKTAFERWREGEYFRTQQAVNGLNHQSFRYGDIEFVAYDDYVGNRNFLGTNEARFFPVATRGLFEHYMAPANWMETVNTMGKEFYSKQERLRMNTGVELHTQANPLFMCRRPSVLKKGTMS